MKVLEQNGGLLSNHEVAEVLKDRGADPAAGLNSKAKASEKIVYEYLVSQAGSPKSRDQLQALLDDFKPFSLTRAELVQLMNLAPTSAVEVHLIVEDCEQRLTEEQIDAIIQVVEKHLKVPAAEPTE